MKLRYLALLVLGVALVDTSDGPEFTDWSFPVNLGPPINTTAPEFSPFLAKDGRTLYFGRGFPDIDIWFSQRASVNDPWETPQNLGANVNTAAVDNIPVLSLDEHLLYFSSTREGGLGNNDLYVSRRHNKRDPLGWEPAVNVGGTINSSADELHPTFFEDEASGIITMYFSSTRPGLGGSDIYASSLLPDGTFMPAVLVTELSSSFNDQQPSVRRDGLEIFLASDRPGGVGAIDLMVSTRASTSAPWSPPVNLGPIVNSTQRNATPALSFDGTALFFQSTRNQADAVGPCSPVSCVFDIYVTTRGKTKGPEK
jgi:hypothetical protein